MSDDRARYGRDPSAEVLADFIVARDLHREARRIERQEDGGHQRAAALHSRGRQAFLDACRSFSNEVEDAVLAVRLGHAA